MNQLCFYTSINAAYLPNARVLARSIKRLFPNSRMILLFNDTTPSDVRWADEPFDYVLFAHELGVSDFRRLAFSYSVVEFCTATKGIAAQFIFSHFDAELVIYLDPDCVVYSKFEELFQFISGGSDVVLTPHITDREFIDAGINYHEIAALKHGTFNLGFIAIRRSPAAMEFLDWWSDRCLRFAYIDFERGIFTDQKWCNLAPYLFPRVGVLLDKSYNVATWNQTGRKLSQSKNGEWLVNNRRLNFYHFSGFGHDFAWAAHEMETFPENAPLLRVIWSEYAASLRREARHQTHRWYWGHFENNVRVEPADRKVYAQVDEIRQRYANPFNIECFRAIREYRREKRQAL